MNWQTWLKGLIAAIISGSAHSVSVMAIAPDSFNIHEGLSKVGSVALISGIISAAFYLAKSPLPDVPKQ